MSNRTIRPVFFTISLFFSATLYAVERNSQNGSDFDPQRWVLFAEDDQHALINTNGHWRLAVRGGEVVDLGERSSPTDANSEENNRSIIKTLIKTGFLQINQLAKLYEQSLSSTTVTDETKLASTQEEDRSKGSLELLSHQPTSEEASQAAQTGIHHQLRVSSGAPDDDYDPSYTQIIQLPEDEKKPDVDVPENIDEIPQSTNEITETINYIIDVMEEISANTNETKESMSEVDDILNQVLNGDIKEIHEIKKPKMQKTREQKKKKERMKKKLLRKLRLEEKVKKSAMHNVVDILYYDSDTTILDLEEYEKRLQKIRLIYPNYFVITPEIVDTFKVDIKGIFNKDYQDTHEDFISDSKPVTQVFNGVCFDDVSTSKHNFGEVIKRIIKPDCGGEYEEPEYSENFGREDPFLRWLRERDGKNK